MNESYINVIIITIILWYYLTILLYQQQQYFNMFQLMNPRTYRAFLLTISWPVEFIKY